MCEKQFTVLLQKIAHKFHQHSLKIPVNSTFITLSLLYFIQISQNAEFDVTRKVAILARGELSVATKPVRTLGHG